MSYAQILCRSLNNFVENATVTPRIYVLNTEFIFAVNSVKQISGGGVLIDVLRGSVNSRESSHAHVNSSVFWRKMLHIESSNTMRSTTISESMSFHMLHYYLTCYANHIKLSFFFYKPVNIKKLTNIS